MQKYEENLVAPSSSGLQPLVGATVTVTAKSTGLRATLYADDQLTVIANPLTTTSTGYYGFRAADDTYVLTFSGSRFATFSREVILDDPKDNPYATQAQMASPNGAAMVGYKRTDGTTTTVSAQLDAVSNTSDAAVRATVLTGLSTATNAAITAADTVLSAFGKLQKQFTDWFAAKDASGGYAGLTGFVLNLWNSAGTFKSGLQNAATAVRTWTLPDNSGTLALTSDIPAAPTAASGMSMALLSVDSIGAAVANIDRLTVFTSAYDRYIVEIEGVLPTSSGTDTLYMRFANGGTLDTAANYSLLSVDGAMSTTGNGLALTQSAMTSTAPSAASMTLDIRNTNDTTRPKSVGQRGHYGTTALLREGKYNAAAAVSGFRLYWSAGTTFASGTVRVYGIKNS